MGLSSSQDLLETGPWGGIYTEINNNNKLENSDTKANALHHPIIHLSCPMLCTFKIVKPSSTISCSFLKFPNRCPSGNDKSVIISSNKSVVSINLKNQEVYLLQLTRTL